MHCESFFTTIYRNFSRSQVTDGFFTLCWVRLCRRAIDFFSLEGDTSDARGVRSKPWHCIVGFLRNIFSRRMQRRNESKIYPRLELPPYDLHFEYNMNHRDRGIALIFNHETFVKPDKSKRLGTDLDRDRLSGVLGTLGFDVKIFEDYPYVAMMQKLLEGYCPL